jgi:uncharacterized protein (TIGR00369 family)
MDDRATTLNDLRRRMAASAFHSSMGIDVLEASEGAVRLVLDARDDQRNLQGSVHGGVLATLADTAMGLAIRSAIEPERRHATIELSVRYLRPASPGRLEALGRTIRVGSSIAFAEADVTDPDGTLVARAQATFSIGAAG